MSIIMMCVSIILCVLVVSGVHSYVCRLCLYYECAVVCYMHLLPSLDSVTSECVSLYSMSVLYVHIILNPLLTVLHYPCLYSVRVHIMLTLS